MGNQNLQDTLSQLTTLNFASRELSGTEDGSHIFEVRLPLEAAVFIYVLLTWKTRKIFSTLNKISNFYYVFL